MLTFKKMQMDFVINPVNCCIKLAFRLWTVQKDILSFVVKFWVET